MQNRQNRNRICKREHVKTGDCYKYVEEAVCVTGRVQKQKRQAGKTGRIIGEMLKKIGSTGKKWLQKGKKKWKVEKDVENEEKWLS